MIMKITRTQMYEAYILSKNYGHYWACEIPEMDRIEFKEWFGTIATPDEFETLLADSGVDLCAGDIGIISPDYCELDGETCVYHATGTGRTRWYIRPSGSVIVEIWRPDMIAPIISHERDCYRSTTKNVTKFPWFEKTGEFGGIESRHMSALARALFLEWCPGDLFQLHLAVDALESVGCENSHDYNSAEVSACRIAAKTAVKKLVDAVFLEAYKASKAEA